MFAASAIYTRLLNQTEAAIGAWKISWKDLRQRLGRFGRSWLKGSYSSMTWPFGKAFRCSSPSCICEILRHARRSRQSINSLSPLLRAYQAGPMGGPELDHVEIGGEAFPVETEGWQEFRSWGKNGHDKFFADIVRSEATSIAEMLMEKRWSVVCAETDAFVTSDKPVAIQHLSRQVAGFGTPGGIVTFPLGPRRVLVMDDMHHEPENQYYSLQQSNVGAFNLRIWQNGSRYMITGRPVQDVLSEICDCADEYEEGSP